MQLGENETDINSTCRKVRLKGNTNLKDSSFTSIVWVLELIDRTLVYGIFLLQMENEDRIEFSRKT